MSKKQARKTRQRRTRQTTARREFATAVDRVRVPLFVELTPEQAQQIGAGLVLSPDALDVSRFTESVHPMRRGTDAPTLNVAASLSSDDRTRRVTERATLRKSNPNVGRRGRIAGAYVSQVAPGQASKSAKVYTESMQNIHKLIASRKGGFSMRDIITKLKIPQGTVGWALRVLAQQKIVSYAPHVQSADEKVAA